jgi:peptide/nickel transport system substrate-binding protein
MRSHLRLAAVPLLISVLATACGGAGGGNTPKQGGKLVIASWQEPDTLLQGITSGEAHGVADVNPVSEGLLTLRDNVDVPKNPTLADFWQPQLATRVPTVENGDVKVTGKTMSVTWRLRHGVTWQDGQPFTSADVKATFDFWWLKFKDKNPTPVLSTTGYDQVTSVDTPDDYTAIVHFKSIFGPYLGLGTGVYGIIPAHLLQETWSQGGDMTKTKLDIDMSALGGYKGTDTWDKWIVGTGPFVFKEWVAGDHMTLVRNTHYWGPHPAYLDELYIKFEPDTNTQLADLRTASVDLGWDFRAALLSSLDRMPNVTTGILRESSSEHIDVNMKNQFLKDPAVRHAILMGIDRQTIIDTLLLGKSAIPPDSWLCIGTLLWCRDPNVPTTPYDPTGAMKLLESAGYTKLKSGPDAGYYSKDGKHGIDLNLITTAGSALREQQEVVIASEMKAIGIRINEPFNNPKAGKLFAGYSDGGLLYTHNFDLAMYTYGWSPGEPDGAYSSYRCDQIAQKSNQFTGTNDTQVCDPQLDAALDAGRHEVALADRKAAYITAQERLAQLLPELPLYYQVQVNAWSTRLHGYKMNEVYWNQDSQNLWLS